MKLKSLITMLMITSLILGCNQESVDNSVGEQSSIEAITRK